MHQLVRIIAVAAVTLFLVRRLPRTPQAFAEETLARNIVKHWEWTDVDPPRDLRDAFLLHTVRTRESQRSAASILDGYKNAVRVALADGFVTREEVQQLAAFISGTSHGRTTNESCRSSRKKSRTCAPTRPGRSSRPAAAMRTGCPRTRQLPRVALPRRRSTG